MAKKEITPEDITVLVDTREQNPFDLTPLKTKSATLKTADYSVQGLEKIVAVERKSLQDYIQCVGRERERFDHEMQRILAFPARLLIIEGSLDQIIAKQYIGEVSPNAAMGSALGWMAQGIPVLFCRDRPTAAKMTARFLFTAARRRWEEAQGLCQSLKIAH